MKKTFFALAAAAAMLFAAQNASAQLYFGGSVGFTSTTLVNGNNKTSGSSYKLSPEIGYQINDRIAVGGTVTIQRGLPYLGSFDTNDLKGFITAAGSASVDLRADNSRFNGFRIAPYFRYVLVDTRRFDLFVDAVIAYGSLSSQVKDGNNVWQDGGKYNLLEFCARPGFRLKFDGGRFSIVGRLGSLGYQTLSQANTTTKLNRFGLDVDTNNIMLGFCISL